MTECLCPLTKWKVCLTLKLSSFLHSRLPMTKVPVTTRASEFAAFQFFDQLGKQQAVAFLSAFKVFLSSCLVLTMALYNVANVLL